jgi:Protein of unknown function (DUF1499)
MHLDDMKVAAGTLFLGVFVLLCAMKGIDAFSGSKLWCIFGSNGGSKTAPNVVNRASAGGSQGESLPSCPPGSMNCIHTTWKVVPTPTSKDDVAEKMLNILQSYPQEGQEGVDKGGWKIVKGDLLTSGQTSLEYQSGVGPFAFLLNFGKPFIDDLEVKIIQPDKIELRSSSRIGKSDLGVNKKRLLFLGQKAKDLGWDVPEPTY